MPRPIILGVVGDSAAGKTTITRGLVRMLGEQSVTHIAADDYHRFDRKQRAARQITPLDPDCNYLDIMEQDLAHVLAGRSILKPVYQHKDGTFGPPVYVTPRQFTVVEGLLGYHTQALRDTFDVRVFLAPPEDLRRQWKVQRDCTRQGLHHRSGARRARSPRGRLAGVHPPAAALGRHRRVVHDRRRSYRPRAPRREADAARGTGAPGPRTPRRRRRARHATHRARG